MARLRPLPPPSPQHPGLPPVATRLFCPRAITPRYFVHSFPLFGPQVRSPLPTGTSTISSGLQPQKTLNVGGAPLPAANESDYVLPHRTGRCIASPGRCRRLSGRWSVYPACRGSCVRMCGFSRAIFPVTGFHKGYFGTLHRCGLRVFSRRTCRSCVAFAYGITLACFRRVCEAVRLGSKERRLCLLPP